MRWIVLACCLALGACQTVTPTARNRADSPVTNSHHAGTGSNSHHHEDRTKPEHNTDALVTPSSQTPDARSTNTSITVPSPSTQRAVVEPAKPATLSAPASTPSNGISSTEPAALTAPSQNNVRNPGESERAEIHMFNSCTTTRGASDAATLPVPSAGTRPPTSTASENAIRVPSSVRHDPADSTASVPLTAPATVRRNSNGSTESLPLSPHSTARLEGEAPPEPLSLFPRTTQREPTPNAESLPLASPPSSRRGVVESTTSLPLSAAASRTTGNSASEESVAIHLPGFVSAVRPTTDALPLPQAPVREAATRNPTAPLSLWLAGTKDTTNVSAASVTPMLNVTAGMATSNRAASAAADLPSPGASHPSMADLGLPLVIPQWLEDSESENQWRESEMERQARLQKEREEQLQKLRQTLYRFLKVNDGE